MNDLQGEGGIGIGGGRRGCKAKRAGCSLKKNIAFHTRYLCTRPPQDRFFWSKSLQCVNGPRRRADPQTPSEHAQKSVNIGGIGSDVILLQKNHARSNALKVNCPKVIAQTVAKWTEEGGLLFHPEGKAAVKIAVHGGPSILPFRLPCS